MCALGSAGLRFQFAEQVLALVKPAICPEPGPFEICTVTLKCLAPACSQSNQPLSGSPGSFEMHIEVMLPLTMDQARCAASDARSVM